MRTDTPGMRAARLAAVGLLLACLCACDRSTPPDAAIDASPATASVSPPVTAPPPVSAADAALAVAIASDEASRAAREQTLRVQRQLVEQQRAEHDAAQRGKLNERCISGQKMRRVANGWVQAGAC